MKKTISYLALAVAAVAVVAGVMQSTTRAGHMATHVGMPVASTSLSRTSISAANRGPGPQGVQTTSSHEPTGASRGNTVVPGSVQNSSSRSPVSSGTGAKQANSAGLSTKTNDTSTNLTGIPSATQPASAPTSAGSQPSSGSFTIVISENHGATVLADEQVSIVSGESLMEYMHQHFNVETAYGDNFVLAIDGVRSQWTDVPPADRKPVDWFLYVNGQEAPVGAANVIPRAGDQDVWDYHSWDPSTGRG